MGRQRDPKRDEAFEIYKTSGGEINLNVIAAQLGVESGTIRVWKNRDHWDAPESVTPSVTLQKNIQKNKRNVTDKVKRSPKVEKKTKKIKEPKYDEIENDELTEKQRLFCLHYVKRFNATTAAIKAGYSPDTAYQIGYQQLQKTSISNEIKRIKQMMQHDIYADAMDVFNKYAAIAFADITDYVEFGQKDEIMMTEEGPVIDPVSGEPMTYKRNYVTFKESGEVDGTLISEVKQGKDGVSVKLHDKMKALEKLERYFDLLPDHHKRKIEKERLRIEQERLDLERAKITDDENTKSADLVVRRWSK